MDTILDYSLKTCSPNIGPKLLNTNVSVANMTDVRNSPSNALSALNLNAALSALIKQQQPQASNSIIQNPFGINDGNSTIMRQADPLLFAFANLNPNLSSAFAPFSQVQSQQQTNATHFAQLPANFAQSLFTPSLLDILAHGNGNVCRSATAMQHAEEAPTSSLGLTPAIAEALQALASNAVQSANTSLNSQYNSAQQSSGDQQPHAKRVKITDNGNGNVPLPVTPNKRPQSLIQALHPLTMSPDSSGKTYTAAIFTNGNSGNTQGDMAVPPLPVSPPLGMLSRHSSMTTSSCVSSTQNSPISSSSKSQHGQTHNHHGRRLSTQSCSSGTATSTTTSSRTPQRKPAEPIPAEKKDEAYYERRRKNNDAAKRSRDQRRQKEDNTAQRANSLEQENLQLRGQIELLKSEITKLRSFLPHIGSDRIDLNEFLTHSNASVDTLFDAPNSHSNLAEDGNENLRTATALLLLKRSSDNSSILLQNKFERNNVSKETHSDGNNNNANHMTVAIRNASDGDSTLETAKFEA